MRIESNERINIGNCVATIKVLTIPGNEDFEVHNIKIEIETDCLTFEGVQEAITAARLAARQIGKAK